MSFSLAPHDEVRQVCRGMVHIDPAGKADGADESGFGAAWPCAPGRALDMRSGLATPGSFCDFTAFNS